MELSEVEDRLSGLAAESDLCSSGWVASLNEKPHDEHEAASGEISLWQRGQFTGGGLYHRVGEMGRLNLQVRKQMFQVDRPEFEVQQPGLRC